MRALRLFVVLALAFAGAVACSSDDSDGAGESEDVSTEATNAEATDDTEGSDDTPATDDTEGSDGTEVSGDTEPPEAPDDDGDLGGDDQALVDALVSQMQEPEEPATPMGEEFDEYMLCAAEGMVSGLGADRLAELGVTVESIEDGSSTFVGSEDFTLEEVGGTRDEAELLADITFDCGFLELMTASFAEQSPESGDCFTEAFDSAEFREAFVESIYSGDDTAMDEVYETVAMSCFDPAELGGLGDSVPE